MTRGIVLFAHGSRDPLWHKPMQAVAAQLLQAHPEVAVECAYLELSTPDLASACTRLAERGISTITIVPLFLGVGKHAREDLPLLVAALREAHPQMDFELQSAVGEDPRLIALLASIASERPARP
ncbi:MAG: sirohydrochlorin chelatase [Rhodoferax sp.]